MVSPGMRPGMMILPKFITNWIKIEKYDHPGDKGQIIGAWYRKCTNFYQKGWEKTWKR